MTDIVVPVLGESVTEAIVADWKVGEGDAVKKDDLLVELETDKVSLEVSAPADGVISKIAAKEGDEVEIGALLAVLDEGAGAGASAAPAKAEAVKAPKATEPKGDAGKIIDIAIPQMGESVGEGVIATWMVAVGEAVKKDAPLVEVETDKVAIEVPSPVDGVMVEHLVAEGDTVAVGSVIARVSQGGTATASAPAAAAPAAAPTAASSADGPMAMPSAARVMAEKGVDPAQVTGTGKGGRITKGDALAASAAPAPAPVATPRDTGPREERVRMSRLRQTIARRLKEAQNTAAMLTTFNEVDMSAIMASRAKYKDLFAKKHGIKLGFMSFFVKACVTALKDVPEVNAEIDGTDIIYKNHYDIGVAVGTEKGLVVPVVRDCDALSMGEVELGIAALAKKARDGKLSMDEMMGATFTITNGGVYGSLMSTPILNAPQSGILGMHAIKDRPMAVNGEVVIRPMMYLALSYDHRVVDGKGAVTFLVRVKECLEDPERLLFDL
ncbi:MAG: 2-oxoglutarate dehydrogenase complex dihydrolipoyllysine-residue succinyltransferase [Robiginitomaculum sp.]|nr:2-oxoglutarate dehydrogenase complex dihydrolipoyllysine-residue succinyltransferase [Robiginitomaculum sp.]